MSEVKSYIGESSLDLCVRGYRHVEGLLNFCKDNGLALDHTESSVTDRLIDDARKAELVNNRALFPVKPSSVKEVVIVNSGQNIVDLALQETGSVEGLLSFLRGNGFSPTTNLTDGQELKVMSVDVVNSEIKNFYKSLSYKVNTGESEQEEILGIGFMIIEDTFIVG